MLVVGAVSSATNGAIEILSMTGAHFDRRMSSGYRAEMYVVPSKSGSSSEENVMLFAPPFS
jgi:hypothetical protein